MGHGHKSILSDRRNMKRVTRSTRLNWSFELIRQTGIWPFGWNVSYQIDETWNDARKSTTQRLPFGRITGTSSELQNALDGHSVGDQVQLFYQVTALLLPTLCPAQSIPSNDHAQFVNRDHQML